MILTIEPYLFLIKNPIIWAITGMTFFCYSVLIELCLNRSSREWYLKAVHWTASLKTLLASLPLLGLLGTIAGLLKTFLDMTLEAGLNMQELISGGIGEAMFTTQLGLMTAVPGILMLAYLNHRKHKWAAKYDEIEN